MSSSEGKIKYLFIKTKKSGIVPRLFLFVARLLEERPTPFLLFLLRGGSGLGGGVLLGGSGLECSLSGNCGIAHSLSLFQRGILLGQQRSDFIRNALDRQVIRASVSSNNGQHANVAVHVFDGCDLLHALDTQTSQNFGMDLLYVRNHNFRNFGLHLEYSLNDRFDLSSFCKNYEKATDCVATHELIIGLNFNSVNL